MTQEQKAKAYDEALERMKSWARGEHPECFTEAQKAAEFIFPELKESEDEKIRKSIVKILTKIVVDTNYRALGIDFSIKDMIAWLEKQSNQKSIDELTPQEAMDVAVAKCFKNAEQNLTNEMKSAEESLGISSEEYNKIVDDCIYGKHTDKIEPKFKIGDFIVNDYCMGRIVEITNDAYLLDTEQGIPLSCEHNAHLWTIQDAKDGDVLADSCQGFNNPFICIFKRFENVDFGLAKLSDFSSYCYLTMSDNQKFKKGHYHHMHNIHPATKEQRDLLFQKMYEAGYMWNSEKKELKKFHVIDEGKAEMDYCFTKMMNGEKVSSAWSEEDEKFFKTALWHISYSISNGKSTDIHCDTTEWLKSLKDRVLPQPKHEWSEEDEGYMDRILEALYDYYPKRYAQSIYDWLKFLKKSMKGE